MDAVIWPEPSEEERQALLAALEDVTSRTPYDGAWREAALREGAESDEP